MRNFFERTRTTAYMCRCGGDLRPTKYGAACSTCGKQVFNMVEGLPIGKAEVRRARQGQPEGSRKGIAILAFGTLLHPALEAAQALGATVVNMRWAKPLDTELLLQVARNHQALVTVEEGCAMGGAGSAVLEALVAAGMALPVLQLGLDDTFIEHGDPARLLTLQGLDAAGIQASITRRFAELLAPVARAA